MRQSSRQLVPRWYFASGDSQVLESKVLSLLHSPQQLDAMRSSAGAIAVPDSAERLAALVRQLLETSNP